VLVALVPCWGYLQYAYVHVLSLAGFAGSESGLLILVELVVLHLCCVCSLFRFASGMALHVEFVNQLCRVLRNLYHNCRLP
jgi:hypothetical protein